MPGHLNVPFLTRQVTRRAYISTRHAARVDQRSLMISSSVSSSGFTCEIYHHTWWQSTYEIVCTCFFFSYIHINKNLKDTKQESIVIQYKLTRNRNVTLALKYMAKK